MPLRWRLAAAATPALCAQGVEQGQVTAVFDVPKTHPAAKLLIENGLDDTGEMILRRVQLADGRTRAFINDQAISVQTLKAVGAALVEIHGQHDERALVDAATHRRLLDAFAGLEKDAAAVEALWEARREASSALDEHRAGIERAAREADYLRHSSEELTKLAPQAGRGDDAGRAPHDDDAEREDRRRPRRGAGGGRRAAIAGGDAGRSRAQAGAPRGDTRRTWCSRRSPRSIRRSTRSPKPTSISMRRWPPRISIRPSWSGSRNGCSRCAPRRGNSRRRWTISPRWRSASPPIWR